MKKLIKKFFCTHPDIEIKTESYSTEHMFIIKCLIQCKKCEKTFTQHPNQNCCYVQRITHEILRDYWINKIKVSQQ